jgi:hypothetical protein
MKYRTPLPAELRRLKDALADAWREFLGADPRVPNYNSLTKMMHHTRVLAQEARLSRTPANEVQIARTHLELLSPIADLVGSEARAAAVTWLEYQLALLAIAHERLGHEITGTKFFKTGVSESALAASVKLVTLRNRMSGCEAAMAHLSSPSH